MARELLWFSVMARLHGSGALIALSLAMVPAAYLGRLAVSGVPIAEGCTAATPAGTGVLSVTVPWLDTGQLSVGLDGFFALDVRTRGITAEEALAALTVDVSSNAVTAGSSARSDSGLGSAYVSASSSSNALSGISVIAP